MNKLHICIISTIFFASLSLIISCGSDDDDTELAWINESASEINDIVWSRDDETDEADEEWQKTGGYSISEQTESKKVDTLNGEVECTILENNEFNVADVTIENENSSSLSLNDGESYVYTINAEPAKKK